MGQMRIGIPLMGENSWVGGQQYIENVVRALRRLPPDERVDIFLFVDLYSAGGISFFEPVFPLLDGIVALGETAFNAVKQSHKNVQLADDLISAAGNVDVLFPCLFDTIENVPAVTWIPDLQHCSLPEYFTLENRSERNKRLQCIANNALMIVVSSQSTFRDIERYCPELIARTSVVPFSTVLVNAQEEFFPGKYFVCSNQFWIHKNHQVIFEALSILKDRGREAHVIFTGSSADYRTKYYFTLLEAKCRRLGIASMVNFLGMIPRQEQLSLMQKSLGVIQPSLFEGWSTVVEDSRALGVPLILSNIDVHLEQNPFIAYYFDPDDAVALANEMEELIIKPVVVREREIAVEKYQENVLKFGRSIKEVFDRAIQKWASGIKEKTECFNAIRDEGIDVPMIPREIDTSGEHLFEAWQLVQSLIIHIPTEGQVIVVGGKEGSVVELFRYFGYSCVFFEPRKNFQRLARLVFDSNPYERFEEALDHIDAAKPIVLVLQDCSVAPPCELMRKLQVVSIMIQNPLPGNFVSADWQTLLDSEHNVEKIDMPGNQWTCWYNVVQSSKGAGVSKKGKKPPFEGILLQAGSIVTHKLSLQKAETEQLQVQLAESEADRAARLVVIEKLIAQLAESEADRAARLVVIEKLTAQLAESEADRVARLIAIEKLTALSTENETERIRIMLRSRQLNTKRKRVKKWFTNLFRDEAN